ncbi:hypothetical protein [Pseudomonas aeruginosa]|uniref:hypothetical protein n=1 Tax=Pseudomonas aeruginosa TaxID=287 RepID=UPI00068BAAF8|nr:hypothetical protein [Pseudomonas aeruginosa]
MSDTLSFASRLCKFVILLVILLIGGASLFLWWLGRPYQDAMSAFVPLLMPMLFLVLAFDTFRAFSRPGRAGTDAALYPRAAPCQH